MQAEGIPDGWDFVMVGVPKTGDWMINAEGEPDRAKSDFTTFWPIIRKIEKPKRYRPFANAAEAEVMWDAKLQFKGDGVDRFRVTAIRATGVTIGGSTYKYAEAFERLECSDGTPFGVEVIDD